MSLTVAELKAILTADTSGAEGPLAQLGQTAEGTRQKLGGAEAGGRSLSEALNLVGQTSISSIAKFAGVTGAAYEVVKGFESAIESTIQWGVEVKNLMYVTGASAQQTSDLAGAFEHYGVSAQLGVRALEMFDKQVQHNGKSVQEYFTASEIAGMKSSNLIQVLGDVQAKFQSIQDPIAKNTFLITEFGARLGPKLGELLNASAGDMAKLTTELRAMGLELNTNQVEAAVNAEHALNDLKLAWKGLQEGVGQEVLPVFTYAIHDLQLLVGLASDVAKIAMGVVESVVAVGKSLGEVISGHFAQAWSDLHSTSNKIVTGWASDVGNMKDVWKTFTTQLSTKPEDTGAAQQLREDTAAQAAADTKLAETRHKNAEQAANDMHAVETAQRSLTQVQRDYNQAVANQPETLGKAFIAAASAALSVYDAQEKVIADQKTITDLMKGPSSNAYQLAQENVTKAQLGVEKANLQVASSHQAVIAAQNSGTGTVDQLKAAQIAQQEAVLGVTDANRTLADAQAALNNLMPGGTGAAKALSTANEQLMKDTLALWSATYGAADALRAQKTAIDTATPGTYEYAQALQKVKDAQYAVAQAQQHATDDARAAAASIAGMMTAVSTAADKLTTSLGAVKAATTSIPSSMSFGTMASLGITPGTGTDVTSGPVPNIGKGPAQATPNDQAFTNWSSGFSHPNYSTDDTKALLAMIRDHGVPATEAAWLGRPDKDQIGPYGLAVEMGWKTMHTGGVAGDEVPAILQRGEMVMSAASTAAIGAGTLRGMNATGSLPSGGLPGSGQPLVVQVVLDGRVIGETARTYLLADLQMGRLRSTGL